MNFLFFAQAVAVADSTGPSRTAVLVWTALGVAALMFGIRFLGQFLAATHPAAPEAVKRTARRSAPAAPPEDTQLLAVIAAAVHVATGRPHRIVSVSPARPPSVESLMLQWSMEGRRAIYSSHRVR